MARGTKKKGRTFKAICLFIGIVFIFSSTLVANIYEAKLSGLNGEAEGTIIDYEKDSDDMYSAIYEFRTSDGERIKIKSGLSTSYKPTIGKTAIINYDEDIPENCIVSSEMEFMSLITKIFRYTGIFFVAIGLASLLKTGVKGAAVGTGFIAAAVAGSRINKNQTYNNFSDQFNNNNQGFNQQQQGFSQPQQQGFSQPQQQGFSQPQQQGFSQPQQVIQYKCPYCGGIIAQGTTICPHCGKQIQWG